MGMSMLHGIVQPYYHGSTKESPLHGALTNYQYQLYLPEPTMVGFAIVGLFKQMCNLARVSFVMTKTTSIPYSLIGWSIAS